MESGSQDGAVAAPNRNKQIQQAYGGMHKGSTYQSSLKSLKASSAYGPARRKVVNLQNKLIDEVHFTSNVLGIAASQRK